MKNSRLDFLFGAVVTAAAFSIGAGFAPAIHPGREYFEACQAFQAEAAASLCYSVKQLEEKGKHYVRLRYWLAIMERFEPDNEAAKQWIDAAKQIK